ncbi:MAG TPA: cadherin-like domain-containing protein [Saprospiraceae bacterium]|nr:cadherin-like domain-containing protein [Saprospiraceae bacterium]HPI04742.1 cadherin-like domain-containing protein [Saprospiraceae bacterium]
MRQFFIIALVLGVFSNLTAQNTNLHFWTPLAQQAVVLPEATQRSIPAHFSTFQLNYEALELALKQAPMEFTREALTQALLLDLPMADGSMRTFKIVESPIMAPELGAKYPALHTYYGTATDKSGVFVRLGVGYKGFHAYIFGDLRGAQSVRRYSDDANSVYIAYKAADLPKDPAMQSQLKCGNDDFSVYTEDGAGHAEHFAATERGTEPKPLKRYRAAISAQAEYSIFNGGTKPLVLAAIVEAMNYITAIQERDFGVRFELIANDDEIIFLDPDTDPFIGENDLGAWLSQNPGAINPVIGVNNYDMGHAFCRTGAGGVIGLAALGSVCDILRKANAASSWFTPNDEDFYLTTAHEMCHQLSGSHTFSNCPPSADNIEPGSAFEPGGGSTIMAYPKACANQNYQNYSDPYYHISSIVQALSFVASGGGNQCGETIDVGNNTPTASTDIPALGLYLPISTPFVLSGSGTDPDGDALTYCWEEYDLGPASPLGSPSGSSPIFRSFLPTSNPVRICPRIQSIISNTVSNTEVLPTYNRPLTFRLTVRDNHTGAGGIDWLEVKMQATTTAGPFLVTYPNELITWNVGEYQIVTWDVANTDGPLVKCHSVNIHLSTDGGLTYPIMLASGVPNSGSYCIQVPNNVSTTARIRVEADDNIFFDISNANFKIQQPQAAGFTVCGALKDQVCLPNGYTTEVTTSSAQGFNTPIDLSITGLPAGATATFSPNPVVPGSNSLLTIEFAADQPETTFTATVQASAGTTRSYDLVLTTVRNDFSAFALLSPADGASGVNVSPVLSWNGVADANLYELELATSPSFEAGTLIIAEYNLSTNSFDLPGFLTEGQAYYWRVRPKNECGTIAWSEPFVFIVQIQTCLTFNATDLPKNISANGTPTVESVITVPSGGAVSDVNVKKVQGNHNFFGDLEVRLVRPTGGNVLLFKNRCSSYAGNFNIAFDDVVNDAFPCPPPQNSAVHKPTESLSAFNGQDAAGDWILRVKDNVASSGGQLSAFQLELCANVSLTGPMIINNNVLNLAAGTNAEITTSLLKTEDANNTADQLLYTLITIPSSGALQKNWTGAMKAGDQFTQTELNNGAIRYFDYGFSSTDDFRFAVTDGEGGLASGTFVIQTQASGTNDLRKNLAFDIAPNPADETVRISFGEVLTADTHVSLYNTAGQLIRNEIMASGNTMLVLQIADLPQGIYTVLVSSNRATGVRKLVVK